MKITKLLIVSAMLMASGLVHAEGSNCAARADQSLTSNQRRDQQAAADATSTKSEHPSQQGDPGAASDNG